MRHTQTIEGRRPPGARDLREAEDGKENNRTSQQEVRETSFTVNVETTKVKQESPVPSSNKEALIAQCDNVNEVQHQQQPEGNKVYAKQPLGNNATPPPAANNNNRTAKNRIKKSSSLKRAEASGGGTKRAAVTRKASVPVGLGSSSGKDEDLISVVVDEADCGEAKQGSSERKRSLRSRKTRTKMVHCSDDEQIDPIILPEKEEYQITLHKGEKGLGITVAGYICEKGGQPFHETIFFLN